MVITKSKLGNVIATLTDYHANGAYEKLKDNVELLDAENFAVMIRTTNFSKNEFTKNLNYITESAYNFLSKSKVYPEDIIMNKIADAGACYFMPDLKRPVSLGMNLFLIRIDKNVANPFFIFSYLKFNEHYVRSFASGSATKTITKEDVRRLKIYFPPLAEQRKIAQILSTWDRGIATTEKLIDASKQQKKALMQQLLTGKKRLVDPETGKAFEGEWEEVKVGEFGKVVTGNTPPKNDDSNYGSDISWATAEDFKSKYVGNTKVKLTKLGASKARIVPKGSVLVTCIASIGKNAIAYENITTNQQINAVVINNNHSNEFFYYQIEFNKHKLLAWAGTTAVPILNKSSFEKIPLSAPLKNEQQRIASVLTAADKEIELLEAKLAHFKQEKKALMQQLLTGKRRVSLSS
jgi:type I restriction enzyme, S subunit